MKMIKDTTANVIPKTIYFAHPFDRQNTKKENLIEKILEQKGYEVINPFREEGRLNVKYGVEHYYQRPIRPFAQEIVKKDYDMVNNCDEFFCWIPKNVTIIGTIIEMGWAILLGKKITALSYKPSPFLLFADEIYLSIDDFVNNNPFEWKEE